MSQSLTYTSDHAGVCVNDEVRNNEYPHLKRFAVEMGIPEANLVRSLEIETRFHDAILSTSDPSVRAEMYASLYRTVQPLLISSKPQSDLPDRNLVKRFARELRQRDVLDVGCGGGQLLLAVRDSLPHGFLCGIDICLPPSPVCRDIEFIEGDIISFRLDRVFDVVMSNQVLEHIAPADLSPHLRSVHNALKPGGRFIIVTPNRLWGPSDVTRIIDATNRNVVPAQGSHLNESTHSEIIPLLEESGFGEVRTELPMARRISTLQGWRVRPVLNRMFERSALLRQATHRITWRGRAIFKNEIVICCVRKA